MNWSSSHQGGSNRPPENQPLTLREQGRRERLRRIRVAAEELLTEKGFDEVTTKEVAERAQVGEATLFRYLEGKADLLLLVVGDKQDQLIDTVLRSDRRRVEETPFEPESDWYLDRICAIYESRINFFIQDPQNVSRFIMTGFATESELGAVSKMSGDRVVERVQTVLEEGQKSDKLRKDISAYWTARNINGVYIHEVLRSATRGLDLGESWDRLKNRLSVMLEPLKVC